MATPEELKDKFWKALKAQRTLMLGLEGLQDNHTRPMTALFEDDAPPIWFFTSTDNAMVKVQGLKSRAIATFASKGHELFATIHGRLVPEHDRGVVERLWNPFVAAWYHGKDDPKMAVLRLDAERAEIWLNDASIFTGVRILLGADPRKAYAGKVANIAMDMDMDR
jgi:general stress protein 26